jgi:hypothetical protein
MSQRQQDGIQPGFTVNGRDATRNHCVGLAGFLIRDATSSARGCYVGLDAAAIDGALAYLALSARYGTLVLIGPLTGSAPSDGMLGVVPLPSAPPDQFGIVVHAAAFQKSGHAVPSPSSSKLP